MQHLRIVFARRSDKFRSARTVSKGQICRPTFAPHIRLTT